MKHLRVQLKKYEHHDEILLRDIDFTINEKDKIALVGGNGVGKSTFLKILTGEIKEYHGNIESIHNMSVGYLKQIYTDDPCMSVFDELKNAFIQIQETAKKLDVLEKQMTEGANVLEEYSNLVEYFTNINGYSYESNIYSVARGLGITDLLEQKIIDVSGGQRTKIALAKILLSAPDILFLDEPTNFIDLESVEWLEKYLCEQWKGGYMIVSHDREFLNKTCPKTFEIQKKTLQFYYVSYHQYLQERGDREKKLFEEYEREQEYLTKEKALVNRFRAGSRAGFAKSREKALNKREVVTKPEIRTLPRFFFQFLENPPEKILTLREVFIGYPDKPLLFIQELEMFSGQKIGILGKNGVGKTTLLKTIQGQLVSLEGKIHWGKGISFLYYSQMHDELDSEKTLLKNFESLIQILQNSVEQQYQNFFLKEDEKNQENNIFSLDKDFCVKILASYGFLYEDMEKKGKYLSGGERSKLLFAAFSQVPAHLLILDEPTNHLDYDARESLEEALKNYAGSVLCISHDRYFINKVTSHLWIIENEELHLCHGNYSDYLYKKERGLGYNEIIPNINDEMDLVLKEKLGSRQAKRLKKKFGK